MTNIDIANRLNNHLEKAYSYSIRLATQAAVAVGPYSNRVKHKLMEISEEELSNAEKLREMIVQMGGIPTQNIKSEYENNVLFDVQSILDNDINFLEDNIRDYIHTLSSLPINDQNAQDTIKDIIEEEQESLDDLLILEKQIPRIDFGMINAV